MGMQQDGPRFLESRRSWNDRSHSHLQNLETNLVIWLLAAIGIIAALCAIIYAMHRLLVMLEDRGYIYYRYKSQGGGGEPSLNSTSSFDHPWSMFRKQKTDKSRYRTRMVSNANRSTMAIASDSGPHLFWPKKDNSPYPKASHGLEHHLLQPFVSFVVQPIRIEITEGSPAYSQNEGLPWMAEGID